MDNLEPFVNALTSFAQAADLHTVVMILLLTFLVRRTFWTRTSLPPAWITWVALGIAFLITPVFSTAAETSWGGRWFVRAALYNGGVAVGLWMIVIPSLVKRWPQLLKDDPLHKEDPA